MPTIAVDKAALYKELGREYSHKEFDELCFDFGIELDEDTTDQPRPEGEAPQLKIEIPANRYDMLCFEGIALNLKVFLGKMTLPNFQLRAPSGGELQVMNVQEDTTRIRPYVSCVVLRNLKFDQDRYDSFIALQDKLHMNLARQRTLVSIGTHDLDTIKGPFSYEALPPEEIEFIPLNQTQKMNGRQIIDFYAKDKNMARYTKIIDQSPVYPIIYDADRTVLSLPPLINGDHSKITLNTKNVFIEITAIDKTKVEVINCILVAMFSAYCSEPFTCEPVKIVSPHNSESRETPDLTPRATQAEVPYLNSATGLNLTAPDMCTRLVRMGYSAKPAKSSPESIDVNVPCTRADVLHQADIMEDLAISYGFNKLPRTFPSKAATIAAPLPINKLTDIVRQEAAMSGWIEVLPLILCSHDENFAWLNRKDDGKTAVRLQNPKTAEYQIVRTSLIPGLLKCFRENRKHSVPMKIFESSDVCFKDLSLERKSRNERHFAAAWCGKASGFEMVHGLLDREMAMLKSKFLEGQSKSRKGEDGKLLDGYWIEESDDATYLAGHAALIHVRLNEKESIIGSLGILHPTVLKNYEIPFPVSTLEFNLEVFL